MQVRNRIALWHNAISWNEYLKFWEISFLGGLVTLGPFTRRYRLLLLLLTVLLERCRLRTAHPSQLCSTLPLSLPPFLPFFPWERWLLNICWLTTAYKCTINEWTAGKLLRLGCVRSGMLIMLSLSPAFAFDSNSGGVLLSPIPGTKLCLYHKYSSFQEPSVTTIPLKLEIKKDNRKW